MALSRSIRNMVLLAKIESPSGTDATPTGSSNAVLPAGEVKLTPIEANQVPRNLMRGTYGSSGSFVGSAWMKVEFSVEKQGSGAAGTAPAWAVFLRAAGLAETVTASNRCDYTPVSTGFETLTAYGYDDGLEYKFIGAVCDFRGSSMVGGVPVYDFTLYAPYLAPAVVSNPATTTSTYKDPKLVNDANTSDLVLGGTYSAGAVSGGTSYVSGGIDFAMNNVVAKLELIGFKGVKLTDRKVTGSIKSIDLTATQDAALQAAILAGTPMSIGLLHGTAAGYKVLEFFPQAKLLGISRSSVEGVRLSDITFESSPLAGNDDLRIVVL